jgi:hypothetical protein
MDKIAEIEGVCYTDPQGEPPQVRLTLEGEGLGESASRSGVRDRMYQVLDYILYGNYDSLWAFCAPEKAWRRQQNMENEYEKRKDEFCRALVSCEFRRVGGEWCCPTKKSPDFGCFDCSGSGFDNCWMQTGVKHDQSA